MIKSSHCFTVQSSHQILLVDDDIEDAMIFRSAVADINRDWTIVHVGDGEKCISYLETAPNLPDFILLDINMPKVNGINCLKHLKKTGLSTSIPIYMLSTSTNETDIRNAFEYGADLYICKPHSYGELTRLLSICINKDFVSKRHRTYDKFLVTESKQLL